MQLLEPISYDQYVGTLFAYSNIAGVMASVCVIYNVLWPVLASRLGVPFWGDYATFRAVRWFNNNSSLTRGFHRVIRREGTLIENNREVLFCPAPMRSSQIQRFSKAFLIFTNIHTHTHTHTNIHTYKIHSYKNTQTYLGIFFLGRYLLH